MFENIFYPHLCLHWGIILHWDSWFPQFWNVCSSGSTGAPPIWSYRFFFSFSGSVEEFLSILSLLNVQTCAFLWAPFILCSASCWAFSIWKPSIVSVFFDFSPLSCSRCLEYNSNVRLCILEVRFGLWIFKNSVLFSYALCNICFLIEMIAFSPIFFFTVLLFGSVKLPLLFWSGALKGIAVLSTHLAIGVSSGVLLVRYLTAALFSACCLLSFRDSGSVHFWAFLFLVWSSVLMGASLLAKLPAF